MYMSRATRRHTEAIPTSLVSPSGRFDALVDMGNPMKGIILFPYLRRRVEGRALGAVGPIAVLELSRTAREAVMPRRWPREVFHGILYLYVLCFIRYSLSLFVFSLSPAPMCSITSVTRGVATIHHITA